MRYSRGLLLPLLLFCLVIGAASDSAKADVTSVTWLDRYQVGAFQEADTSASPPDTSAWVAYAINENSTGVIIGAFEIVNDATDTDVLTSIQLFSYMEQAYSSEYIRIYQKAGGSGVRTLARTINMSGQSFQTGEIINITNLGIQIAASRTDTVYVEMDANTEPIRDARLYGVNEYNGKGVGIAIMPDGLTFLSDPVGGLPAPGDTLQYGDAPDGTDFWNWCTGGTCQPTGYWVIFDTKPPVFELMVYKEAAYAGPYNDMDYTCVDSLNPWCTPPDAFGTSPISLGDSIYVRVDFDGAENLDSVNYGNIRLDNGNWGAFVVPTASIDPLMDTDSMDTDGYSFIRHRIPDPLVGVDAETWGDYPPPTDPGDIVRIPTDFDDNYPLVAYASDDAGNIGVDTFWFCREVDTKKPMFDSIMVDHHYDPQGDGVVSVGDSLYITAYMTSNQPYEVSAVGANLRNFIDWGQVDSIFMLEDVSLVNNNTIWRTKVELTYPVGDMDSTAIAQDRANDSSLDPANKDDIWLMAWDDACNPETTYTEVTGTIDLDAPVWISDGEYKVWVDTDTNYCTNFGDTIRVRVDLLEVLDDDIASVTADLIGAGLNRDAMAMLNDAGTNGDAVAGDWTFTMLYGLSLKDQITATEPYPADAKDTNGFYPEDIQPGQGTFDLVVTAMDVHGNTVVDTLTLVDVDDDPTFLDTKRPEKIKPGVVNAYPIGQEQDGQGLIAITFPKDYGNETIDTDAVKFHIFEVNGSTWGDEVGLTTIAELDASLDSIRWESEYYDDGQQVTFGIRTEDDCGNWEFNNTILVSAIADGLPATACFIYPVPPHNGSYGPNNPFAVTAQVNPDVSGLMGATLAYRLIDAGGGTPGPWLYAPDGMSRPAGGNILYDTLNIGNNVWDAGEYEMVITTIDSAGNELTADEAYDNAEECPPIEFTWHLDDNWAYFVDINGNISPTVPGCGYEVTRDTLNQATVSLAEVDEDTLYRVDVWAIFDFGGGQRDSVRVHWEDGVTLPFTFDFSVFDWPKSNDGIPTMLYVEITDLRSHGMYTTDAMLCVPDEVAPDAYLATPYNCSRIPIAKSDLDSLPLTVKISDLAYDPDNPIRAEFFWATYDGDTVTKIGETGWDADSSHLWFQIQWHNGDLADRDGSWIWLYAVVYDEFGNAFETPWNKVYLDGTMPFMTLSSPQFTWFDGAWRLAQNTNGGIVDLAAEITSSEVDIYSVDFYLAMRDSTDLFHWYKKIGTGIPANNNSIWTYNWDVSSTMWSIDTTWVGGDVGGSVESVDTTYGIPCGYWYKLRIMVTDIAGNVYDDMDGSGFFDDYTFWDYPWNPMDERQPADESKLLFYYDCGAPDVAFCDVWTMGEEDTLWFPTPSSKLGGPGEVYSFMGDDIKMDVCLTEDLELFDINAKKADYYFWSPVINDWKLVCTSTDVDNKFECQFNPWDLALIYQEHIQDDEFEGGLKVVLTDSLNQTSQDVIDLYILDNYPGFAWWKSPTHDDCLWDTPTLRLYTINADSLKEVTYYYSTDGETWVEIGQVFSGNNGEDYDFPLSWPTMVLADGEYMLGFEIVDRNDNVTGIEDNQIITVTVNNMLPTIDLTMPEGLPLADSFDFETVPFFVWEGMEFGADAEADNGISWVQFEYKEYNDGPTNWTEFNADADQFPPYQSVWSCEDDEAPKQGDDGSALIGYDCDDGFYHFRAKARNDCGRIVYTPWYIGYNDETCPDVSIITVNGDDAENNNDWEYCYPTGSDLTFEVAAFDTASPYGSSELTNSGVAAIAFWIVPEEELNLDCVGGDCDPDPDYWDEVYVAETSDGIHSYDWATSGLEEGNYYLVVEVIDWAGNSCYTDEYQLCLYDDCPPPAYVAGFKECTLVGLSECGAYVQFQYLEADENWTLPAEGASWTAIGIAERQGDCEELYYDPCDSCCGGWTDYAIYTTPWRPSDGNYWVRMIATEESFEFYDDILYTEGKPLPLTVSECEGFAALNPEDFGPATIEKSWESLNNCDLDGVGMIETAYDMPFAIAFEHNEYEDSWDWEILELRAVTQQGDRTSFGGPFDFEELTDYGGFGWGHVFFFDEDTDYTFSLDAHLDAYWITEDLGTGGPIYGDDGNVMVDVPREFTNDNNGSDQLMVIWESKLAPASVIDDVKIVPVGNANGDYMYFIGNPGCEDVDICGDDHKYATIKMYYDPEVDLTADQLKVMWYSEGHWYDDYIYFPSTVEGFNTDENYVEFATECLSGFFAVVKVQDAPCDFSIVREYITPWCDGYTYGRPDFQYRIPEAFDNDVDWGWLEIKVDGVRIYTGSKREGSYGDSIQTGNKSNSGESALGVADGWDVDIDPESGRIFFYMDPTWCDWNDDDYDDGEWDCYYMPPLDCGTHTVTINALDDQLRDYCITDEFMVDCVEPDVDFENYYVSKNPTITFDVTDDASGVDWDNIYVDIFFIFNSDTTAGGSGGGYTVDDEGLYDYYYDDDEYVVFMQSFFPDQVKDYLIDDNTVQITTHFERDDEEAILVVINDGERECGCEEGYGVPADYYGSFDDFYHEDGGVYDCVGNVSNPHMQILAVDYDAPSLEATTPEGSCPMIYKVFSDGAGMESLVIMENGNMIASQVSGPGEVDEGGEYYLSLSTGEGATLYYCPNDDVDYEIHITDLVGNVRVYNGSTAYGERGTLAEEGIKDLKSYPNPWERGNSAHNGGVTIMFDLVKDADVTVTVYDVAGNMVNKIFDGRMASNPEASVKWDGFTTNGIEVATGVYLVRVEAKDGSDFAGDVVKVAIIQD